MPNSVQKIDIFNANKIKSHELIKAQKHSGLFSIHTAQWAISVLILVVTPNMQIALASNVSSNAKNSFKRGTP